MESNREPRPSSDEARASLDVVDRVNADLADRLISPWWYSPGLGLAEALLVSSMTFSGWRQPAIAVFGIACLIFTVRAWERLTGLGMSRHYNALAPEWTIALLVVLAVAIAVVLLVDEPVVTAITALVLLVSSAVLGRLGDRALRNRLRHGSRAR
jgi:hypothetical protein